MPITGPNNSITRRGAQTGIKKQYEPILTLSMLNKSSLTPKKRDEIYSNIKYRNQTSPLKMDTTQQKIISYADNRGTLSQVPLREISPLSKKKLGVRRDETPSSVQRTNKMILEKIDSQLFLKSSIEKNLKLTTGILNTEPVPYSNSKLQMNSTIDKKIYPATPNKSTVNIL